MALAKGPGASAHRYRAIVAFLLAAVLAMSTGAATPSSASDVPAVVVRGTANHGLVWNLTKPVELNIEYARAATTGRVLGVVIENAARTRVLAMSFEAPELRMPREGDTLPPPATWSTRPTVKLEPGSYFVRLIGNGSGRFSIPLISGSPADLLVETASKRATITWHEPDLSGPVAAAVRDATPIALPPNGAAIYAVSGHTDVHAVSPYLLCFRPDPGTCADAEFNHIGTGVATFVAAQRVWWRASFQVLANRDVAPGAYAGETNWAVGGMTARFDEVAVVVGPSG
jgi:hypothetical protein